MLKKLTDKVQKLNQVLEDSVNGFAKSFIIEPESQDLLLKKGSLYVVFDISGNTRFEVGLISNVVHDMLHDAYYQSDNISPIQSLEKAITEVRDRVTQLANESIIIERQEIDFNIVAGALWGNVMYVVQYGSSKSYLMRTGDIRPISTTSEGNFSAASGVVKDDDVIIFSTNEFAKDFPPDRLLTVAIPENQLTQNQACLLMKFIIDTNFTQNEIVDFGNEAIKIKTDSPRVVSNVSKIFSKIKLPSFKRKKRVETVKPVTEIGLKLKPQGKLKFKIQYIIPVLALALGISIFATLQNKKAKNATNDTTSTQTQQAQPEVVVIDENTKPEEQPDSTAFYELKLTDPQIQPTEIAVFNDTIVVTDSTTGKIYTSARTTPKFTAVSQTYPGIGNLLNIKGQIGFTDNQGYKVLKTSDQSVAEDYKTTELGVTSAYADFVYTIKDGKVTRFAKESNKLNGSLWGQNQDMAEVKSFGISYSLFILKNDGNVVKYTSGEKNSFVLSGENPKLNNPAQILADVDFDYVYVADSGNKRVVSFDKNGKIIKEYKADSEDKWNDIKSIGVSPDEKTLYVLTGTRIYEAAL